MTYNDFGQTGIKISRLGIGALHWGPALSDREAREMIELSLKEGINYIDTARAYGQSESILGRVLTDIRESFYLSSKSIKRNVKNFQDDLQLSLGNLKTDYLDFYFIHDVSDLQLYKAVIKNGIYAYLQSEKAKKRVKHICMSTHDLQVAETIITSRKFDAIMLAYNPADPRVEEYILPLAQKYEIGTIIMKPFGGGVLCGEKGASYGLCLDAKDLIRFCLSHPNVQTTIPGVDSLPYLRECVDAEKMSALDSAEIENLKKEATKLGRDFCRGCGYCNHCPQGIAITEIMGLYSQLRVYKGINWQQMFRLQNQLSNTYGSQAENCVICRKCEDKCPYNLPISTIMGEVAAM